MFKFELIVIEDQEVEQHLLKQMEKLQVDLKDEQMEVWQYLYYSEYLKWTAEQSQIIYEEISQKASSLTTISKI